eukprot:2673128-Prymnesium_polylepis.1
MRSVVGRADNPRRTGIWIISFDRPWGEPCTVAAVGNQDPVCQRCRKPVADIATSNATVQSSDRTDWAPHSWRAHLGRFHKFELQRTHCGALWRGVVFKPSFAHELHNSTVHLEAAAAHHTFVSVHVIAHCAH